MSDLLITGGTVVDGTGGPAYRADVRVRDGVIVEVGEGLERAGEPVIDATGAFVTPGLIDCHTHYDLEMFWDPSIDPLPSYGMTTAIIGNCGLTVAPIREDVRDDITDLLCFIEELPASLSPQCVPWGWRTWSEYYAIASRTPIAVSLFAYTGHNALRASVMGRDAWERAATVEERAAMVELLEDALTAGSLGLSSNFGDHDRDGLPVPSRLADGDEFDALLEVLARYPHATYQVVSREDDRHTVLEAAIARGVRSISFQADGKRVEGIDDAPNVWSPGGGVDVYDLTSDYTFGFDFNLGVGGVPAWNDLINGPLVGKLEKLADSQWRAQAREEWDNGSLFRDMAQHLTLTHSETDAGPTGILLADYYEQHADQHQSDVLADWVLANGIGSRLSMPSSAIFGDVAPKDEEEKRRSTLESFKNPKTLIGGTDGGAHLKMFCGSGGNLYTITHWVRDEQLVPIELAVHVLTGRNAEFFGLHDRGRIAVGLRGDLAVFALDEIETHKPERVDDLPDGDWRLSRPSAGFRATVVAGVPTVLDGKPTDARPANLGNAAVAAASRT